MTQRTSVPQTNPRPVSQGSWPPSTSPRCWQPRATHRPPDAAATRGPVHNLTHHLAGPLTLLAIGAALTRLAVLAATLDWTTHITFDRAAGHTLRNPDGSLR